MDKSTTVSFPAAPLATYRIESLAKVMTPALAIYVDVVDSNIQTRGWAKLSVRARL